LIWFCLLTTT
jgi:hypothetical protein